ncbi:MAG: hypothetical protein ACOY4T_11805 [Pseudomonadota bacterium]
MTLSFPLSLAAFWDLLPISTLTMDCAPQLESAGTGAGQVLTRELAPALWRGTVTLGRLMPDEAAEAMALVDLARQSGASFLMHDLTRPYPALDPDGLVLGMSAVTVQAIGADRRELRLTGLPTNYPLRRGDLVGVTWGASPVRYGLHRIVVAASADASGLTGWNEVAPALPVALIAGASASLARPPVKAIVVPGSARAGTLRRGLVEGTTFDFLQTVR